MKTVAEGVATQEQLDLVRALGCDRLQGYIFSKPVSGSTVKAMLGEGRKRAAA
jgi:EAL domain-containing protein (putative c-di-GMP-specific phosphodiesterase class I)